MPTDSLCRVLPFFQISHVPPLTALAASVYATMLFPGDEQRLDRWACAQAICLDWRARYTSDGKDVEDALPVVRSELLSVLDFVKRVPFDKLMLLRNKAYSAGHVLKFSLLLDMDSDTTSSVGKAIALTIKHISVEKRTLMSRWAEFKAVAHLWAAYNDLCVDLQKVGPEWQSAAWTAFLKDPRPILAIAKSYRDWAVLHTPSGSKSVPTLDSRSTWDIPESIGPLPKQEFFNRQRLYSNGLTPDTRELLNTYRKKMT